MSSRAIIYLGLLIGSTVGGYLPVMWGGSLFSYTSVITSAIGATVGVIICRKLL